MSTIPYQAEVVNADVPASNATLLHVVSDAGAYRSRVWYDVAKRLIDAIGALFLLLVFSPLFAAIAVAVKLTSRGPCLFRHRRMGQWGQEFWCYKFRSMATDAEARLQTDARLRAEFEANYKIKHDPRVTPLGRLLRTSSMDELPQLWNVLRGDMSLVGPRPVVADELARYGSHARKLLVVKPGVSGLWQVSGRSDTTYAERVQFDMNYIDRRSFLLDAKLLLLTVVAVYRKAGAC